LQDKIYYFQLDIYYKLTILFTVLWKLIFAVWHWNYPFVKQMCILFNIYNFLFVRKMVTGCVKDLKEDLQVICMKFHQILI